MPTLTNAQGVYTGDCTTYDTLTVSVISGAYSLEYPIGTVLASASTASNTYQLGAGQYRISTTGSVSFTVNTIPDSDSTAIAVGSGYVPGLVVGDASAAAANTAAINAMLQDYASVVVNSPNVYVNTIKIPSGRTLVVNGSLIRAPNTNFFTIINEYQAVLVQANATTRASNVVTITGANAPWSVGQQIFVANGMAGRAGVSLQTSFLGTNGTGYLATLTSVTSSGFSYAQTGTNQTASASAQDFLAIIPVKETLAAASISVSAGVATVTQANHTKRPGMVFYLGSADNAVSGLQGVFEVVSTTATTWTFATSASGNPTAGSTFILNWDADITITGDGYIDGNRTNNVGALGAWANRVRAIGGFGCCTGTRVSLAMRNSAQQLIQFNNCVDTEVLTRAGSGNTQVAWQFDGGGKRNTVRGIGNSVSTDGSYPSDDFSSLLLTDWNVSSPYNSTISPYGLWSGHTDTRIDIRTANALNGVKIAGNPGYTYDNIVVEGASNSFFDSQTGNGVWVHDDGAGFAGAAIKTMKVQNLSWRVGSNSLNGVRWESTGTCDNLIVSNFSASNIPGVAVRIISGTIKNLRLNECDWVTVSANTAQRLLGIEGGTVRHVVIKDSNIVTGNGSSGGLCIDLNAAATVTHFTWDNCMVDGISSNTGYLGNISTTGTKMVFRGVRTGPNTLNNIVYLATAASVYDLRFEGCDIACQFGFNDNTVTSVGNWFAASNSRFTTNASFNVIQVAGGSTWSVSVDNTSSVSGGGWIRSSGSTATYSLFGGQSLKADAALVGTRIARTAGSTFFTTTASGTVVANNLLVCDATGAANSFKQISDTTKAV